MRFLISNPGLLVWLGIFAIAALVCAIGAVLMQRSGVSLRPIAFFLGFLLLIGGPQFLVHLYLALNAGRAESPHAQPLAALAAADRGEAYTQAVQRLFGPDADPQLVLDVRSQFGEAMANAEFVRFAAIGARESVLLARFAGRTDAERAWVQYLRVTGLGKAGGKGDSASGYAVSRPAGDRLYALPTGNLLAVWTGPDDNAIRDRMLAGGFDVPRRSPLMLSTTASAAAPTSDSPAPIARTPEDLIARVPVPLLAAGLSAYLLIVVYYFFRGAAWAGSSPAKPVAAPVSAFELGQRLEAINRLDVPFHVERSGDDTLIATWRYADAKWMDHARLHGMQRTHRIRLQLDEANRIVRATDSFAAYDWSAGGSGAQLKWQTGLGITFYQYEHQRVFGLQLDDRGQFKPALSYAYTFDLQEMKSPLIEAVTRAGWTWRPVAWQGPAWLRWLTQ
jgi:hypothetical protein